MRYMVERNFVQVIGQIWMPATTAAMTYDLDSSDVRNIREFCLHYKVCRDSVEDWLGTHSGDFRTIDDFYVTIGDWESEWAHEESEATFNDCMFPCEEEDEAAY